MRSIKPICYFLFMLFFNGAIFNDLVYAETQYGVEEYYNKKNEKKRISRKKMLFITVAIVSFSSLGGYFVVKNKFKDKKGGKSNSQSSSSDSDITDSILTDDDGDQESALIHTDIPIKKNRITTSVKDHLETQRESRKEIIEKYNITTPKPKKGRWWTKLTLTEIRQMTLPKFYFKEVKEGSGIVRRREASEVIEREDRLAEALNSLKLDVSKYNKEYLECFMRYFSNGLRQDYYGTLGIVSKKGDEVRKLFSKYFFEKFKEARKKTNNTGKINKKEWPEIWTAFFGGFVQMMDDLKGNDKSKELYGHIRQYIENFYITLSHKIKGIPDKNAVYINKLRDRYKSVDITLLDYYKTYENEVKDAREYRVKVYKTDWDQAPVHLMDEETGDEDSDSDDCEPETCMIDDADPADPVNREYKRLATKRHKKNVAIHELDLKKVFVMYTAHPRFYGFSWSEEEHTRDRLINILNSAFQDSELYTNSKTFIFKRKDAYASKDKVIEETRKIQEVPLEALNAEVYMSENRFDYTEFFKLFPRIFKTLSVLHSVNKKEAEVLLTKDDIKQLCTLFEARLDELKKIYQKEEKKQKKYLVASIERNLFFKKRGHLQAFYNEVMMMKESQQESEEKSLPLKKALVQLKARIDIFCKKLENENMTYFVNNGEGILEKMDIVKVADIFDEIDESKKLLDGKKIIDRVDLKKDKYNDYNIRFKIETCTNEIYENAYLGRISMQKAAKGGKLKIKINDDHNAKKTFEIYCNEIKDISVSRENNIILDQDIIED